jgi:ATP phosphoribosyltransferase
MSEKIIIALPSKGRLMEQASDLFEKAGIAIQRSGQTRGYFGRLSCFDDVEVRFLSASEIAYSLKNDKIHLGITGEDLLRETLHDFDTRISIKKRLGFGPADVVVAVPQSWLDVATMADLEEVSLEFQRSHARRLRVATKYINITRRFFAAKGVTGYQTVESPGATEGAPAAGTAEIIVDITSTGSTLVANKLKILDDGIILKSEAVLALTKSLYVNQKQSTVLAEIIELLKNT